MEIIYGKKILDDLCYQDDFYRHFSARLLSYEVVRHVCANLYALISCFRLHCLVGVFRRVNIKPRYFLIFRPSITKIIMLTGEKESPDKFQINEGFLVYFNSQKV